MLNILVVCNECRKAYDILGEIRRVKADSYVIVINCSDTSFTTDVYDENISGFTW